MALQGLFKQFSDMVRYWKTNLNDFIMWISTFLAVLVFGVSYGLFIGIAVSLILILRATVAPPARVLTQLCDTEMYFDANRVKQETGNHNLHAGVAVFSFPTALYFANAEGFKKSMYSKLIAPSSPTLTTLHTIVVDMSACSYIDSAGINALASVTQEYLEQKELRVLLAGCSATVLHTLLRSEFLAMVKQENIFASVHDAVTFALNHHEDDNYLTLDFLIQETEPEVDVGERRPLLRVDRTVNYNHEADLVSASWTDT
eukprot:m.248704 g.248704  ORF g.248704 m.248704 type:complete len:259 (+) comp26672_c2_seq9:1336-2112(+)